MSQNDSSSARRDEIVKQGVVFFFGAGASIDAGIPDTYEFVIQFKQYVEEKARELSNSLSEILKILEKHNEKQPSTTKREVDVEQLLVTFDRLKGKDEEVLLDFYGSKVFNKAINTDDVSKLEDLLQVFIRKTVVIEKEQKLEYLQELTKFVPPTLEIFSVNYDTCIEQLCYLKNLKYTDGFDIYWNHDNFARGDWDIKLFKLHGSVIWFESQTKEYVKIPIRTFVGDEETSLKLITGENLRPLLIYPMQKWQYVEPLTELQLMFKERLMNKATKILVVVGYSFRDDYIIRMLWDAARINNDLRIILLNPSAQDIFKRRLKYLDDGKTPSRIAERVVCLPYPFRTAIHHLKNYLQPLENCVYWEKQYINKEKYDQKADWKDLLALCIDCEFSTKAESIFEEKIGEKWLEIKSWAEENVQEKILLCMKALLHSSIVKDEFETKWLDRINRLLGFTNIENLRIADMRDEMFSIGFISGNLEVNLGQIHTLIERMMAEIDQKSDLLGVDLKEKLNRIMGYRRSLEAFRAYLDQFQGNLRWEDYLKLRENLQTEVRKELNMWLTHPATEERKLCRKNLEELVLKTERSALGAIYEGHSFTLKLAS